MGVIRPVEVIKTMRQIVQSLIRVSEACFDNLGRRSLPFTRRGKGVKHNLVKCNFPLEGDRKIRGIDCSWREKMSMRDFLRKFLKMRESPAESGRVDMYAPLPEKIVPVNLKRIEQN